MSSKTDIPPRPGSGAARRQAAAKAKGRGGPKSPWVIIGGIAAVVALVGVIAIAAGGGSSDSAATEDENGIQEMRDVTVEGDPLPGLQDGVPDSAVGMTAPTISGQTFSGVPVSLPPTSGKATMLVFLAHWCPHCQVEVPILTEWDQAGGVPDGVEIFGVATSTDEQRPNYPPSAWLERENFPFGVMADNAASDAATAYGVTGYPFLVMLDADGAVVWRTSGEVPVEELERLVTEGLAASPT